MESISGNFEEICEFIREKELSHITKTPEDMGEIHRKTAKLLTGYNFTVAEAIYTFSWLFAVMRVDENINRPFKDVFSETFGISLGGR